MRRLPLLLLLAALVWTALPQAASAQGDAVSFVVRPADGAPTSPEGGWFLFDDATGGAELTADMALRNDSPRAVTLELAAVDAGTARRGGVEYGLPEDPATHVGAWVALSQSTVRLEPGASAQVPFTVSVPADAAPGDHLAGIAVWASGEPEVDSEPQAGMAPGVDIETRQVVAVQLQVPGHAPRSLELQGVEVVADPTGPYLEVLIENTGRRLERGTGRLVVDGEQLGEPFPIGTVVPGTSLAYPVPWPQGDVDRPHEVSVTVEYGAEPAMWEGTVVADAAVREALVEWAAPGTSGRDRTPILLLVGGLCVALLVLLSLVRWWRVRRGEFGAVPADRQLDRSRSS